MKELLKVEKPILYHQLVFLSTSTGFSPLMVECVNEETPEAWRCVCRETTEAEGGRTRQKQRLGHLDQDGSLQVLEDMSRDGRSEVPGRPSVHWTDVEDRDQPVHCIT